MSILVEIAQCMSDFARTKLKQPTHLYVIPSTMDELVNEVRYFDGECVLGLQVIVVGEMPANAEGRRLFVA